MMQEYSATMQYLKFLRENVEAPMLRFKWYYIVLSYILDHTKKAHLNL